MNINEAYYVYLIWKNFNPVPGLARRLSPCPISLHPSLSSSLFCSFTNFSIFLIFLVFSVCISPFHSSLSVSLPSLSSFFPLICFFLTTFFHFPPVIHPSSSHWHSTTLSCLPSSSLTLLLLFLSLTCFLSLFNAVLLDSPVCQCNGLR